MAAPRSTTRRWAPRAEAPGLCAWSFRSKHADEFAAVAEEAWQKAMGLTAVTSGQQAEPGLIIDREDYHGVQVQFAKFAERQERRQAHLPTRFNFSPAMARVGNCFVLSSTLGLTRDLIDSLNKDATAAKPLAGTHTLAAVDGVQLGQALKADREALVTGTWSRRAMRAGRTRDRCAHRDCRAGRRGPLTGTTTGGQSRVELEVSLNLP